ncbi:MAG: hypothetical protein GC199_00660 [Alphaproteobacteria bacterium]|nr:hypothetical protein [Alphaproteobacteria bacterium]
MAHGTQELLRDLLYVRVINMKGSDVRRAQVTEQLARFKSLDWRFFDAIDGRGGGGVLPDQECSRRVNLRDLRAGEVGNYSSHRALWAEFLKTDKPYLLALEDDIRIDDDFISCLKAIFALPKVPDHVKLCAVFERPFRTIRPLSPGRSLVRYRDEPLGVQAYLLSRKGAGRFFALSGRMCRPVDHFTDRSWEHGIPTYGVHRPVITEDQAIPSIVANTGSREISRPRDGRYRWMKRRDRLGRAAANLYFDIVEPFRLAGFSRQLGFVRPDEQDVGLTEHHRAKRSSSGLGR